MAKKKTTLKIGKIRYINSIPFYHGLAYEGANLEFYENYPTKVNLAMRQGKVDVAPVSSLEYLNHQEEYLILPGLGIGSRDFSGSVILLSHERIEGLNKATVALTRESLSSPTLLRVLLKFKYKFNNKFISSAEPPEKMAEKFPACLVIGDSALMYKPAKFIYRYDLSELWWNWTEKPFCFSVWVVRKKFAQTNPELVAEFRYRLLDNLLRNLMNIEKLIKESLEIDFLDSKFSKIFGYLFNLNYNLDVPMQEGLKLFYRLAHRLEVSPKPDNLHFFNGSSSLAHSTKK